MPALPMDCHGTLDLHHHCMYDLTLCLNLLPSSSTLLHRELLKATTLSCASSSLQYLT